MKQAILFLLFCGLHAFAQTQSVPLPAVKNGKWFLIDGGREIRLPKQYSSVGLFDREGTALFTQSNQYGILDRHGKELISALYFSLLPLGNGYYQSTSSEGTELLYITDTSKQKILCDSVISLEPNWIYYEKDSSRILLNTISRQEIVLGEQEIYHHRFNYVLVKTDFNKIGLFDPLGKMISDTCAFSENQFYVQYKTADRHLLVDRAGSFEIPVSAQNASVSENRIHYSIDGMAYLLDRESRQVLVSVAGDKIEPYNKDYYLLFRKGLRGFITHTGRIALQPEYNQIERSGEFYKVSQKGRAGLLDLQFRKVVPCEYATISYDSKFFYTFSITNSKGLISRVTGKELLKPMYTRIKIENTLIKAWNGNNLSIVEIGANHEVKSKLLLDNAILLKKRGGDHEVFDPRLFPLGWFCDSVTIQDSSSLAVRTSYRWGIKTANDSMLALPRMSKPIFVQGAPVSLLNASRQKVKGPGSWGKPVTRDDEEFRTFEMVNFSTGKKVPEIRIIDLDSTDFSMRGFARFAHTQGCGILRADGSAVKVAHVDHSEEEFIRVCYKGDEVLVKKKEEQTHEIPSRFFNAPVVPVSVNRDGQYRYVKYDNARWNFLDQDGNALFNDSFSFALPFYKQTALVKSKNNWGVVGRDSIVIPLIYKTIQRIPEYADTVFKVMAVSSRKLYFDSLFRPVSESLGKLEKQNGSLSTYSTKGTTKVLGKDYEVITEGKKVVSLHDFARFSVKTKKTYEIFDASGKSLGESFAKPDDFLDEDFFTSGTNSKVGLMSVSGDTVAPFIFSKISKIGTVFLAESKSRNQLYALDGTLIKSTKAVILLDSVSGKQVEIAGSKITFFDSKGKKTAKIKSELRFSYYFNGFLISRQGNFTILSQDGKEILAGEKFSDIAFFEKGICALYHAEKKWLIFDAQWQSLASEVYDISKIKSLGENVLLLQVKSKFFLLDLESREIHKGFTKVSGKFEDGLLLVSTDAKRSRWYFINRDFQAPFARTFNRAKPFRNGLACVADATGWTIIGSDGLPKSLPSYGELEQVGHRIFQMNALPTYGLIDSRGKAIIEPIYEKITILPDNLIQVIKNGQIGYFDYKGNVIYAVE